MKKFARVLALMLVATMLCAMLVACGAKPASDPKEAKDALEENGYKATHLSGVLVEAASSAFGDGVTDIVTGIDGDDSVTIVWFEEEDDAKDFYEELEEKYEESKAELDEIEDEDVKEELQEELDNAAYGISGNMVWMGTKEAVKAAK
jgi:ABC-type glycerol-3-phosphate transport system substrate-binding protein